jgi:cytochrome c-type protein NapC
MKRICLYAALVCFAIPAHALDWAKHKPKDITLFYPGQLSWEMMLTQSEHSGADKFREGKDCRQCHEGEEAASGKLLVADKSSEKQPIAGKPGSIKASMRAAVEGENLLIRLDFEPGQQPDAGQEPKYPLMAAVMIDDGAVAEAKRGGCYAMCHDDMQDMPSAAPGGKVTKYIARSRVKISRAGGAEIKPADQLDVYRAQGAVIEYWQAKLAPGAAPVVVAGAVLDKRTEHPTPSVTATANEAGGVWSVVFSRKLSAGTGYKSFEPGKLYTLGFAVHAGHTAHRFHYVSLEKTLMIEKGSADLIAMRD